MKASKVFERIRFIADGAELPPETDHVSMANEAGEWLCGVCHWRFLSNKTVLLDVVGGQDYIELPTDFHSLQGMPRTSDLASNFLRLTTAEEQSRFQALGTGTYTLAATVDARTLTDASGDLRTVPVLSLSPAPTTDMLQAVILKYTAGWVPVEDDNSHIHLPKEMHPLYLQVAGEYAEGVINREEMSLEERLARIQTGPLFFQAKRWDKNLQGSVGRLRNGIGSRVRTDIIWSPAWADVDFL